MDEELAIAILEVIKAGEAFGPNTVLDEIRKSPKYFDVDERTYKIVWYKLKEVGCLLLRDDVHIHRDGVKLNPDKDCLSSYLKRREDRANAQTPVAPIAVKKKSKVKEIGLKVASWIVNNIWLFIFYVLVAIVASYLLVRLKIPH